MRRVLTWMAYGLATLFAGYWAFVNGFQVITALTFATRADAPSALWALIGLYGLHVVAACVAWLGGLRAMAAGRLGRGILLGLASAAVSWPWLALLYARLAGA